MTSVFRIHPNDLEHKLKFIGLKPIEFYNYNFLDIVKDKYDIDINIYYVINSLELFKLKYILFYEF